jgi:hypothetical protein
MVWRSDKLRGVSMSLKKTAVAVAAAAAMLNISQAWLTD